MTKEETVKILSVTKAAYPSFYKDISKQDGIDILNLWSEMFADEPYELVAMAVKQYISTDAKHFHPPGIGEIKEAIRKLASKDEMTEMEAWGLVSKALRNSTYGSKEEYAKLPEVIQRVVGSPDQLRAWAALEADDVETVIQSNFLRSYRVRAQNARDQAKLPQSVRDFARILGDKMAMPSLPGECL